MGGVMSGLFHSKQMPSNDKCLLKGPIGIFWDIENCAVPSDVLPEDVAGNIRTALQNNSMIEGEVTLFSAFADLMSFSKRFRECFYRTGVKIVDVPNNRKEAADKAILVDMFLFALDNRPPSSIMLISGDADFAPTLHILGQRGYNVILVIPTGVCVSPALQNAGRFVWDWPSLAHGKGFVTPCSIPAKMMRTPVKGSVGSQVKESKSLSECSSSASTATFYSYQTSQSAKISSSSPETSARTRPSTDKGCTAILQPRDMNEMKFQLVKSLELSGGCLSLNHIPKEYLKLFQRPLISSEYGGEKPIHYLEQLSDVISIRGNTDNKEAFLAVSTPKKYGKWKKAGEAERKNTFQSAKTGQSNTMPSCSLGMSLLPGDMNVLRCQLVKLLKLSGGCLSLNQFQQEYARLFQQPLILPEYGATRLISLLEKLPDVIAIGGQSNNRVAYLQQSVSEASSFLPGTSAQPGDLNDLKRRLIKLLKTYGGHLLLSRFPVEYAKLFQHPLDVSKFGATKLISLLEKLSDIIIIGGEGGMLTAYLLQ